MQVLIATNNKGKKKDFEALLAPLGIDVLTLADMDEPFDVEETGTTFEANARLKAEATANHYGTIVIADDSGLVIDALNGEPGVYSARYAGEAKDDEANIDLVLERLQGVPEEERTARFVATLAVAYPNEPERTTFYVGTCEGRILEERRGKNGFGYDPIFFVPSLDRSMAELTLEEKGAISHRGAAIRQLAEAWNAR